MDAHHRLGIQECLNHDILLGRPVLVSNNGEITAHFKATVLVLPNGTMRLTAAFEPPYVHSDYSIASQPILSLLKNDVRSKK
jgi:hypothetical protein